MFAASEADAVGRDFYAVRGTRDFDAHGLGAMVTRVDRPFLDRQANVYELDHRWTPNAQLGIRSTVVASEVRTAGGGGARRNIRDSGVQVRIDYDMGEGWRQQLYAVHLGDELQLNDFGFLERNNFNYARYDLARRVTGFAETSPYSAKDWHWALSRRTNDQGLHLADAVAINRRGERRDGGSDFAELAAYSRGHDDLITRGNRAVAMPAKLFAHYQRSRPRQGDSRWEMSGSVRYSAGGLGGIDEGRGAFYVEPTYHVNDRLSFFGGLELVHHGDWLLWRGGNLLGSYRADQIFLNSGAVWVIGDRQELRVRLEAIGLDARARQAWRVAADGEPVAVDEPIPDFALRNLGFQIRYRYELAPLSHLYIAYVRGGELYDEGVRGSGGAAGFDGRGAGRQFSDAFNLRDSEQLLVKLSYRFEI
ncbi:MAG: hypothetical protein KY442_11045 [Proteobacteria bacterium]|nr:hypothetical protein [Pseudomonadota bacterium]